MMVLLLFASDGVVRVAWPEIDFDGLRGTAVRRAVM